MTKWHRKTRIFSRDLLFAVVLVAVGMVATAPHLRAWDPGTIHVSCPEGTERVSANGYPFFQPEIDLFSGLYRDIRQIRTCAKSGFLSYRAFTADELDRIEALMQTSDYQSRSNSMNPGALALWIETKLNGTVEARLKYQLMLNDAYHAVAGDPDDESTDKQRLRAVFDLVRDGHAAYARDAYDLARLQTQLAYLSHRADTGNEATWFDTASNGFSELPKPRDPRESGLPYGVVRIRAEVKNRYNALRRNLDALNLCFDAPAALSEKLCEAKLNAQNSKAGYHGVEALAEWALRGPTSPESREEEESLRSRLEWVKTMQGTLASELKSKLEKELALGPEYFRARARRTHQKMQAVLQERIRSPLFRQYFDRLFIKNIKGRTHRYAKGSAYYCDLFDLINPYTKGQCHLDGTPAWIAAHERLPDLMADLREERRQEVLEYAAFYYLKGDTDHRSVRWAEQQADFEQAIEAFRQKKKR